MIAQEDLIENDPEFDAYLEQSFGISPDRRAPTAPGSDEDEAFEAYFRQSFPGAER